MKIVNKLHGVLISVLKNMFNAHLHIQLFTSTLRWRFYFNVQLNVEDSIENFYETSKPHLKKLSLISHHLVVSIGNDSVELQGRLEFGDGRTTNHHNSIESCPIKTTQS
jgi:hypothetical protein